MVDVCVSSYENHIHLIPAKVLDLSGGGREEFGAGFGLLGCKPEELLGYRRAWRFVGGVDDWK